MGRDIFHQTRLLRAPSNLAFNTSREEAFTASLGNLGQGLTTLMGKNFFLISNLNLPSVSLEPFPLVLSLHPLVKSPSPGLSHPAVVMRQRSAGRVVVFSRSRKQPALFPALPQTC